MEIMFRLPEKNKFARFNYYTLKTIGYLCWFFFYVWKYLTNKNIEISECLYAYLRYLSPGNALLRGVHDLKNTHAVTETWKNPFRIREGMLRYL